MKKDTHFYHKFLGYGLHKSRCKVHVFSDEDQKIIVFQDLADGTSVTNAIEILATEIGDKLDLDPEQTTFIECYPYYSNDYSVIKLEYDLMKRKYNSPNWEFFTDKKLLTSMRHTIKDEPSKERETSDK